MPWSTAKKDPAYGQADYKRKRLECLRRAGWRCEIRLPGICAGAATQADHTDQLANDPQHQHLRAACTPCHRHITAQQGNRAQGNHPDPAPQPRTTW